MGVLSGYISRTDAYLGVLAIVISNNMAAMDATSPNNGYNLDGTPYGGVTDPVWIGVTQQGLSVVAWYVSMSALVITIIELLNGIAHDSPVNVFVPTLTFLTGNVAYHISLFFQDVSYWFNRFVTDGAVQKIPEREGLLNYIVTEIPTALYLVVLLAYTYRTVRLSRENANAPHAVTKAPLPARKAPLPRQGSAPTASHARR